MERTRKKSSKQLLEEKQMKRYFRSKKRSQSRANTDNEHKDEENHNKKSDANITEGLGNQKITKCLSKQGPEMTTNEKSIEKRKKRKESEKVIINDSSVTLPGNGQGKSFKGNADIYKIDGQVKDINGIETTKKYEWSMETAECLKEEGYNKREYKEVEPNIVTNNSTILTPFSLREENNIAYTHATMGRTGIEKYNSNGNKDEVSKSANETLEMTQELILKQDGTQVK